MALVENDSTGIVPAAPEVAAPVVPPVPSQATVVMDPADAMQTVPMYAVPESMQPKDMAAVLADPNSSIEDREAAIQQAESLSLQKEQSIIEDKAKKLDAYRKWEADTARAREVNEKAKALGGVDGALPDPTKYGLQTSDVAQFSNETVRSKAEAVSQQRKAQEAFDQAKAQEEQAQATISGKAAGLASQRQKTIEMDQKIFDDLAKDQDDLSAIDPNRFWNNQSTASKIIGSIAIGLGSLGSALTKSGSNDALKLIMQAIQDDIGSQKINNEQKLAKKLNAMKRADLEISKFSALSDSDYKKQNLSMLQQQLQQQQQAVSDQLMQSKKIAGLIASPDGMPRQDAEQLLLAKPELRDTTVTLPNGNMAFANSKGAAEDLRKYVGESEAATTIMGDMVDRYKTLGAGKAKMSPEDRRYFQQQTGVLVGKLRLALQGPGVLTDTDIKMLKETIGDPTNFLEFPDQGIKSVAALQNLIKTVNSVAYKQAGLGTQLTNSDKYRINAYKRGENFHKIESVIDMHKKKGTPGW